MNALTKIKNASLWILAVLALAVSVVVLVAALAVATVPVLAFSGQKSVAKLWKDVFCQHGGK